MNIAECIHGDLVPPFKMRVKTAWERYRFLSFWQKEPETIAWIKSFEWGDCFYDVGANIGMYTLYACHLHPSNYAVAFEPQLSNYNSLVANIGMNRFRFAFPLLAGVSNHTGWSGFEEKISEAGSSGGQLGMKGYGYTVQIHALDDFARPFGRPDHIKIDIDGQEAKVIDGMRGLIADRVFKSCLIEITKDDAGQYIRQFFLNHGYTTENEFNAMEAHSRNMPWRKSEEANIENVIFTRLT